MSPMTRHNPPAASLIESFEPPPLDEGIAQGLDEFVARRRCALPDEAF